MKFKSTSRINLRTTTSVKRYVLTGISLSILIVLGCLGFFYLESNEEARAESNYANARGRNSGFFEKFKSKRGKVKTNTLACKPKSNYKKGKVTNFSWSFKKKQTTTPYRYVYTSASAAPPRAQSNIILASNRNEDVVASIASVNNLINNNDYAPLVKVPAYSWSKELSTEERKMAVLNLRPIKELPPIRFITNQDEFSVVNMDSFMEALEMINQGRMVLIEGHTDDMGSNSYNLNLSVKRVEKIRQLMLQAGANDDLISVKGYGESKPLVPNLNSENRQVNRRIEFKVFEL